MFKGESSKLLEWLRKTTGFLIAAYGSAFQPVTEWVEDQDNVITNEALDRQFGSVGAEPSIGRRKSSAIQANFGGYGRVGKASTVEEHGERVRILGTTYRELRRECAPLDVRDVLTWAVERESATVDRSERKQQKL